MRLPTMPAVTVPQAPTPEAMSHTERRLTP